MTTPLTSVSDVDMLGFSAPLCKALSFYLPEIDKRVCQLQQRHLSSAYFKQKPSFEEELEDFFSPASTEKDAL